MMRVDGPWRHAGETQAVFAALASAGHRALFVGGVVRNALLGAPVADIDIATDARPQRVIDLAEGAGLKAVPTGIDHGTVTVVSDGAPYEITTFRRDVETDGRRATVAYSDRIEDDAARRDFTMNALYAEADGTLVDPLGGLPDALARRVRFIGRPEDRIREDYLRILRFFRFHAWYGGIDLDPDGLAACAALADGMDRLARERIGAELTKLLAAPDPAPSVATMAQVGVLAHVLAGASAVALAPLVHLEGGAGVAPDAIRRLAALGGTDPGPSLRLSKADARRLEVLRSLAGDTTGPAEIAWRHGRATARDAMLLRCASLSTPLPPGLEDRIARGATASFPVRPADLMPDYTGPALGARLAALERAWIDSDFALTREQLLAMPA